MAQEETEVAEAEETEEVDEAEDFDPERALATIKAQRAAEKRLKAELAEAREAQAELDAIKQAQEDAEKSASDKLAERESRIAELEDQITRAAVKADFERQASERGITDLRLAYLAAKEQGLLGEQDPKTGNVEGHDLDKLEEMFPALAGEADDTGFQHDAGTRGRPGKTGTVGSQFNEVVRRSVARR